MIDKNEICTEIKYFQMYLHELISDYYISEAVNNFYDENKIKYISYGNFLTDIVKAVNYRQHMLFYLMYHEDKDSKSIPRLLNKIQDNKMLQDQHLNNTIKSLGKEISKLITDASVDIKNIKEYRDNVYAHWNKNLFKKNWQQQFKKDNKFDYEKMIVVAKKTLETLDDILFLFNEESYIPPDVSKFGLNKLINAIKQ